MRQVAIEALREALDYNPETGRFTWKFRPRDHFQNVKVWKNVNNRFAGKEAGAINKQGYRIIQINGLMLKAHRIVIALADGRWPEYEVDHINQTRDDNRLANLRKATRLENMQNRSQFKSNTSGVTGVFWHKDNKKWVAFIRAANCQTYLGSFVNFDNAVAARKAAEVRFGFHKNHGRAA